jgi:hypothetical protein
MSALQDISQLLEQWLHYTEAETSAIQSAAWPALHEIQEAKSGLQKSVTDALDRWALENHIDTATRARADHPFRCEVNRLISLEARNSQLLSAQFHAKLEEKKSRDEAVLNLRRVRRSYGRMPDVGWHSYS